MIRDKEAFSELATLTLDSIHSRAKKRALPTKSQDESEDAGHEFPIHNEEIEIKPDTASVVVNGTTGGEPNLPETAPTETVRCWLTDCT